MVCVVKPLQCTVAATLGHLRRAGLRASLAPEQQGIVVDDVDVACVDADTWTWLIVALASIGENAHSLVAHYALERAAFRARVADSLVQHLHMNGYLIFLDVRAHLRPCAILYDRSLGDSRVARPIPTRASPFDVDGHRHDGPGRTDRIDASKSYLE